MPALRSKPFRREVSAGLQELWQGPVRPAGPTDRQRAAQPVDGNGCAATAWITWLYSKNTEKPG